MDLGRKKIFRLPPHITPLVIETGDAAELDSALKRCQLSRRGE